MRDPFSAGNMTGSILVAHPNLGDPNFRRTILFLSHHHAEDGAVGLVLNRPLEKRLDEIAEECPPATLAKVPVFEGGPVSREQILVTSLRWQDSPRAVAFRGLGGPSDELDVPPELEADLRAFAGYAGWDRGQLESEIAQKAWIVMPPTRDLIEMSDPHHAWHRVMTTLGPAYRLLAQMPDDPELN